MLQTHGEHSITINDDHKSTPKTMSLVRKVQDTLYFLAYQSICTQLELFIEFDID